MPTKGSGYKVIVLKGKTPIQTLAKQQGMTVDQINALNGLDLKKDTLLAAGSEIIVADLN